MISLRAPNTKASGLEEGNKEVKVDPHKRLSDRRFLAAKDCLVEGVNGVVF